jgi:hypothetical protein
MRAWLLIPRQFKRIMKKISFALTLLLLLIQLGPLSPPQSAAAQAVSDRRFGAVESFWAPNEAAELGVGWERILFYWNEIQPHGPSDWNTLHVLEEWLVEARAHNRTILGLLKNTPYWATDGPDASGVPRGLYLPVDDPGNLWANYVRQSVAYYGPRGVNNWIIWNEPDIAPNVYGHEFSGTPEDYYRLLKVAYIVIKQTDPNATVHLGGMTYWHDPGFLRRFLNIVVADPEAAANNYFFDVISLHIYFRPETIPTIVGNAYAVQQQLGINPMKSVWINETNARPSMDPQWPVTVQQFHLDLEQQAWYIPQAIALGFYAGAGRISLYKLVDINMAPGDESWGLIRPYDFSRRPAFYAYKTTIQHLAGFTYPIQREMSANHYAFSFNRPQGVTRIVWARTTTPVTVDVPAAAASATLYSVTGEPMGEVTAVNGRYRINLQGARCHQGECLMGGPPVFVVEGGASLNLPTVTPGPPPAAAPSATPDGEAGEDGTAVAQLPGNTPTATVELTPSPTSPPTETATPRPTRTPTVTPTPEITPSLAAVTLEPEPAAVALVAPTQPPPEPATVEQVAASAAPWTQMGFWLLGLGVSLAFGLFIAFRRRTTNDQ